MHRWRDEKGRIYLIGYSGRTIWGINFFRKLGILTKCNLKEIKGVTIKNDFNEGYLKDKGSFFYHS